MHKASCHCGKVALELDGDLSQANECNCSHCSRKGYLLVFLPRETVTFRSPPEDLPAYRFNRHVINHHFCPDCGCAPFSMGKGPDGREMVAVNLRCVEGIDLEAVKRVPVDGRSF
ncbi:MAG: GFA family protein [Rhizobiaceae bacterium]|nr:GFA family protein [Rhizobiaceae bacterium]MCV0405675.1 GFA family protein [Rhizobiaceae bacterium]